jgi:phage gp36-like protein
VAYLDLQDLLDELGEDLLIQLTDDDGTGEVGEKRVGKAIAFAYGRFNASIQGRGYSIPVPATEMVKSTNLDLAIYQLYKGRTSIPEGVYIVRKNAFNDAIQLLKDITAGKASLDIPTIEQTIEKPKMTDKILTNAAKSKFNDNALKGY